MSRGNQNPARQEALWQVGRNIRKRRRQLDLSQEALAFNAGVHRTQITAIETGRVECGILTLFKIAVALDVPTSAFFVGVE